MRLCRLHHIRRRSAGLNLLSTPVQCAYPRGYAVLRPRLTSNGGLTSFEPASSLTNAERARYIATKPLVSSDESTIYALSSGSGRAAIAVIRISGPACGKIYNALCPGKPLPRPRYAAFRKIYDPTAKHHYSSVLDSGSLVLSFPAPNSVTGQDVLELHVHGGPAVVKAVLRAIGKCDEPSLPVRYAEAGEFTRRAFINDRLDLTQVEALGETLSAVTEEQRRLSVQGTISGLADRYESWRQLLLQARGELEALIDFQEDQHFEESSSSLVTSVTAQVKKLMQTISFHTSNAVRGELLRNGISLSLIGSPNVGKSSLLNQIVGRNAAIVSHEPGTTRDIVEVGLDIGGFFCRLGDTAGLRRGKQSSLDATSLDVVGAVEEEGIKRAKDKAMQSDLVLVVFSVEPSPDNQGCHVQFPEEIIDTTARLLQMNKNVIIAVNKVDLYGEGVPDMISRLPSNVVALFRNVAAEDVYCISCKDAETGPNGDHGRVQILVDGLVRKFRSMTKALTPEAEGEHFAWEESLGANARHRDLLQACNTHLSEFVAATQPSTQDSTEVCEEVDLVVAAESLRQAADCLARITGRGNAGDVEEVLGVVFEKFCVGK